MSQMTDFVTESMIAQTANLTSSSLFQCQPSSDQSGHVYTPNISDFYFNHKKAAAFSTGPGANLTTSNLTTHFFTLPPESSQPTCSGNVTALQYCYQTDRNLTSNLFTLLLLSRNESQFTLERRLEVLTTPQPEACTGVSGTRQVCCNTTTLDRNHQFQIDALLTFGIDIRDKNAIPLFFACSVAEYQYEHFKVSITTRSFIRLGRFTLGESNLVNCPFPLLRFLLGNCFACF